jgi:hypothetical protein
MTFKAFQNRYEPKVVDSKFYTFFLISNLVLGPEFFSGRNFKFYYYYNLNLSLLKFSHEFLLLIHNCFKTQPFISLNYNIILNNTSFITSFFKIEQI